MATPVKRIEKEYFIKMLYDEKLPLIYIKDRVEYKLTLDRPATEDMILRSDKPIEKLKPQTELPLIFNFRGQVISFTVKLGSIVDGLLACETPETLYKDLDRDYLRIEVPRDLKILFNYKGDRYNLSFPKVPEYEDVSEKDVFQNQNTSDVSGLIKQIVGSMKNFADGYKIVNFQEKKPESIEERIVSETGKTLFIPSTAAFLPKVDPYPKKRIITEDILKRYLESTGVRLSQIDELYARFIKNKYTNGIFSDAWIPILFQEYVIGYIHIWVNQKGRLPFDYNVLDNLYQLAKVLAFSLKENGYFETGKVKDESFEGKVLDISASGLLFACAHGSGLISTLLVDSDLIVNISSPERTIKVIARIVRRFKDKTAHYVGCRFVDISSEDTAFLFEHLYGRKIDDKDAEFLSGQV